MSDLTHFERAVMHKLLAGEDEILAILRDQLTLASVNERQMTGAGFFTRFTVPKAARLLPINRPLKIGDVKAKMPELDYGAGFLLYIENGLLHMLEGYSFEEPWPERVSTFELSYVPRSERDMADLRGILRGDTHRI
jgi:hypothetical protein